MVDVGAGEKRCNLVRRVPAENSHAVDFRRSGVTQSARAVCPFGNPGCRSRASSGRQYAALRDSLQGTGVPWLGSDPGCGTQHRTIVEPDVPGANSAGHVQRRLRIGGTDAHAPVRSDAHLLLSTIGEEIAGAKRERTAGTGNLPILS